MSHVGKVSRLTALVAVAALALSSCGGNSKPNTDPIASQPGSGTNASSIVIDTTFDLKTVDPGREYEPTGQIIVKALYDTLLTFADGDLTTPIPDLATYEASADLKEFTFKLQPNRVFPDGTAVTADDVVFSLQRLQGIKGNPSFMLDGVTISKVDDTTVKATTKEPAPALPAILSNPSCGILSKAIVEANGGTTGEDDGAEAFLNGTAAGTGPYTLTTFNLESEVVLEINPKYTGPQKPTYQKVILRNVEAASQKMNVERGDSQVALGLSGDQVTSLASNVELVSVPSATVVFLLLNANPKVSELTSKPEVVQAFRDAIDYAGLLELGGTGAGQATSLIPTQFLGTLPQSDALTRDLDKAKKEVEAAGLKGKKLTLSLPNDIDPTGLNLTMLAERLQSQLAEVGITVELAPAPFATEIDAYRDGKEEVGLWYWNPDYLDPANYLAFGPGESVGLRAGWTAEANPKIAELVSKAYTTGDHEARKAVFEEWGRAMNSDSPFIPLVQPGSNVAHAPSVTNVIYNPSWLINVAGLGAK